MVNQSRSRGLIKIDTEQRQCDRNHDSGMTFALSFFNYRFVLIIIDEE